MAESVSLPDFNSISTGKKKVLIVTLGCRLNQTESEAIARAYSNAGYIADQGALEATGDRKEDVSLAVVNTCAVTTKAEQKARREIRVILDKCPNARVIVTGCYAALNAKKIEEIDSRIRVVIDKSKLPIETFADAPIGTEEKASIEAEEVSASLPNGDVLQGDFMPSSGAREEGAHYPFLYSTTFTAHSRASLKVQDGCNSNCAYCTIRIARGKSISLNVEEAVRRAREIEKNGYKEIALTGVNLCQWRSGKEKLPYLLKSLLEGTRNISFRLSSLNPEAIDDTLFRVIEEDGGKRIRRHFHLSVQSGSNRILKMMNRPYTRERVIQDVNGLREALLRSSLDTASYIPPFISCDIITGFPGESGDDFNETLSLCLQCGFVHIHAFPFSPRPFTQAYKMRPCIAQSVAGRRVKALEKIAGEEMEKYIALCKGKVFRAIAENRKIGDGEDSIRCVTENFLHVKVDGIEKDNCPSAGDEIKIIITGQDNGEICKGVIERG